MTHLICTECNSPAEPLDWHCTVCGGPIDFADYPTFDATKIVADDFTLWRYGAMLPVEKRISLGEGMTPLTPTEIDGMAFHAKLEYLNPTGSYKDRGTVTMMNHIAAHNVTKVVEDSSGNAGASVAAYSSALGIDAQIYVPETGSPSKKALIAAFGGELMEIPGPQHAKTEACQAAAAHTTYASHAWSPYFVLGQMTVAYEVWEQLGKKAPDAVVTPLGHGGLFLGFARGFRQLLEAGLIDKLPKLYAVQSEKCDPIVSGWESNVEIPPPVQSEPTVADGIIVDVPVRGKEVLRAIRQSGGAAFRVTDDTIVAAQQKLAAKGFIVEPTSATTLAAMQQIRAHLSAGNGSDKLIVASFTGNGLKNVGR